MKRTTITTLRTVLAAAGILLLADPQQLRAQDDPAGQWTFDLTLYGLAADMSGDVTVKGVSADLDVGFDTIMDHLEFGAMGKFRVGYERWALTTEVIYMGLGASKNSVNAEMDQWIVEPSLSYRVCEEFEVLAGVRYNSLTAEISGTGPLGNFREISGTQDWWDPIIGANFSLPFAQKFSLDFRGDVGGFGAGSELTWQAFPYVGWHFNKWGSVHAGYRWVYVDYENGSGATAFKYDMLTQGPQLGFTFHF